MGQFDDAVKQLEILKCPRRCGGLPEQIERINFQWFCSNCSHSWPVVVPVPHPETAEPNGSAGSA